LTQQLTLIQNVSSEGEHVKNSISTEVAPRRNNLPKEGRKSRNNLKHSQFDKPTHTFVPDKLKITSPKVYDQQQKKKKPFRRAFSLR
jgi:hypothetical protein